MNGARKLMGVRDVARRRGSGFMSVDVVCAWHCYLMFEDLEVKKMNLY